MTDDANDLSYAEALAAAAPRIAEVQASMTARLDQAQAFLRDVATALRAWMAQVAPLVVRVWQGILRWIQRQGPLAPALAYATPAMRRRAARARAHAAMQAKQQAKQQRR
jgi:hypothetical protein